MLDLAQMVQAAGKKIGSEGRDRHLPDPRVEAEEHYYNAKHSKLIDLGLQAALALRFAARFADEYRSEVPDRIDPSLFMPRVNWRRTRNEKPQQGAVRAAAANGKNGGNGHHVESFTPVATGSGKGRSRSK